MRLRSGTVIQSGLKSQPVDYGHQRMRGPALAVVLNVYYSDDPQNQSSTLTGMRGGRGSRLEAHVLVVSDPQQRWELQNVIIPPRGTSGIDNFSEEVPKGTTGTTDGSVLDYHRTPLDKFTGDWCVVDFIAGRITRPFMVTWWPHRANTRDPVTRDQEGQGNPVQGRRLVKRFQGTRLAVTSKGSLFLDTSEANAAYDPSTGQRRSAEPGGDVRVTVKENREFEINFNPPVFNEDEPDLLWGVNPPHGVRSTDLTRLLFSKEFIRAVAGEIMELQAFQKLCLGTDAGATENFVLGQSWKTMMTTVLNALAGHAHPTGTGASGVPYNATTFTDAVANLDDQLSDWIFGQKDPPTP